MRKWHALLQRFAHSSSGAAAVEFAIVCLPLLLVCIGTVEFGRAFFVRSDLAHAADVAARKVLIGQISADAALSEAAEQLENAVLEAFDGDPFLLQVSVGAETIDGVQYRTLSIRYPLTLFIPGLTDSPLALSVFRRIPVG